MYVAQTDCILFDMVTKLGSGAYATVYGDASFAYKVPHVDVFDEFHILLREGILLRRGYGVPLYGCLVTDDNQFAGFIMKRCQSVPRFADISIFDKLFASLYRLHRNGWIHGDIKMDNFVYDPETSQAFLIDFGLSMLNASWPILHVVHGKLATLPYRPLEYLKQEKLWTSLDASFDHWSLGMSLFWLYHKDCPFDYSVTNTIEKVLTYISVHVPRQQQERIEYFRSAFGLHPSLQTF